MGRADCLGPRAGLSATFGAQQVSSSNTEGIISRSKHIYWLARLLGFVSKILLKLIVL
jgi:hypothetical protein